MWPNNGSSIYHKLNFCWYYLVSTKWRKEALSDIAPKSGAKQVVDVAAQSELSLIEHGSTTTSGSVWLKLAYPVLIYALYVALFNAKKSSSLQKKLVIIIFKTLKAHTIIE